MVFLSLSRRTCALIIISLLPYYAVAQGKLALFTNFYCTVASTLLPTVEVPLSTCLVPIGAVSVYIDQFPACDDGSAATMIMYSDTSCSVFPSPTPNSISGWQDDVTKPCYYLSVSNSVPSVMFTCDDPSTHPQASAATTVTASLLAPIATGSGGSSKTSTAGATTTQQSQTPSASNALNSGNSGTSSSTANDSNETSSSGLSTSDKIAIGVGLGVGLPTILIAFAAWCWPRGRY
jgi:hypothetical protein